MGDDKLKKKLACFLFVILALVFTACEEEFKNLEKTFDGQYYQINYPEEWNKQEFPETNMIAFSITEDGNYYESVSVITIPGEDYSIEEYKNMYLDRIEQAIVDEVKFIDKSFTTLADNEAFKIKYVVQGIENIKYLHLGTINNGNGYLVSYTSSEEKYDDYIDTVEDMINSFRFK